MNDLNYSFSKLVIFILALFGTTLIFESCGPIPNDDSSTNIKKEIL